MIPGAVGLEELGAFVDIAVNNHTAGLRRC
jgi:hypothetical protein